MMFPSCEVKRSNVISLCGKYLNLGIIKKTGLLRFCTTGFTDSSSAFYRFAKHILASFGSEPAAGTLNLLGSHLQDANQKVLLHSFFEVALCIAMPSLPVALHAHRTLDLNQMKFEPTNKINKTVTPIKQFE